MTNSSNDLGIFVGTEKNEKIDIKNQLSAAEYWNNCLEIIRDNIDSQAYSTWFEPIRAKSLELNNLTVQIPSQWYQEWIEEHYYMLLDKTIKRVLGDDAKLFYETVVVNNLDIEPARIYSPALKYPPVHASVSSQDNIRQSNLNPRYVFESFVVGESNQLPTSAAKAVSKEPGGTRFNPFFIYGNSGLGKTHLAQAIGNYILQNNPKKKILYTSSEQFTIDFVSSVQNKKNSEFISLYRNVDVLIIDDIQFLSGKEQTQEKLFYTYEALYQEGKQIILTADRAPKDIPDINERLVSRFIAGLTVEIKQPDLKLRTEIIKRKIKDEGINLSDEIIEIIARNVTKSIREIEGTIIKLIAMVTFDKKAITADLVHEVIHGLATEQKPVTINEIKEKVALQYNVKVDIIESKSRKHEVALARQMAIFLARKYTTLSLKSIGDAFGGRDHSTVLHSCQAIQNYLDTDRKIKVEFDILESIINNR